MWYRGRFGPSPTGSLHFGSLVAAVASWVDARAAGGEWLVRMEDIDTPRVRPGAADSILATLERFGLHWDGPVSWQSQRGEAYSEALERLSSAGLLYPCSCTRKEIVDSVTGEAGAAPGRYLGTCATGLMPGRLARSWRVRVEPGVICFHDRAQGTQCQDVDASVGDFILRRADGLFAYQLAVTVDDAVQGITAVVRGADLMEATHRQIHLRRILGLPEPSYLHVPVVTDATGAKLSKHNQAEALSSRASAHLTAALEFLGQQPPVELERAAPANILEWAVENWRTEAIPVVEGAGCAV
ncbi:MAG: tRNA glutamyl-Q(34) synthetase GluQRS [Bryobacteraceae bacterium]